MDLKQDLSNNNNNIKEKSVSGKKKAVGLKSKYAFKNPYLNMD